MRYKLMAKALIVVTILWLSTLSKTAVAGWEKTSGGTGVDCGYSVIQMPPCCGGGYVIVGYTNSYGAGLNDVYLIKTDSNGDTIWTKTFGGTGDDCGYSVIRTTDDGYIIGGNTSSYGAGENDVYLIKTNSEGDTIWTKTYGGTGNDVGFSVVQTTDGGYIIAGAADSYGAGLADVYLIKTNSAGDTVWTKTFGGANSDSGYSVAQTSDGSYIIAGTTRSYGAGARDVFLIKIDSEGNTIWTKTYGGVFCDVGYSIAQTSDGGYIIGGKSRSYGAGLADVYLIKTNSEGNTTWTKTYGGVYGDFGFSVAQTSDGGYIIAGATSSYGAGGFDAYLIKTNSAGDTIWTKTYGGDSDDYGYSVAQAQDGGYIVAGYTKSYGAGLEDVYLIKVDAYGVREDSHLNVYGSDYGSLNIAPTVGTSRFDITYRIPSTACGSVNLIIYDLAGRQVKMLFNGIVPTGVGAGIHSQLWNGIDMGGQEVESGIYFCQLTVGDKSITKKMIIVR